MAKKTGKELQALVRASLPVIQGNLYGWRKPSLTGASCVSANNENKNMHLNNLGWWLITILNLVGYFIFRFGMISRGNSKVTIEFIGGITTLISFILMFIIFGIKNGFISMVIFIVAITPAVELIIRKINRKLYGHYFGKEILSKNNIPDVVKQELLKRNEKKY